jgi:hypothetical protein
MGLRLGWPDHVAVVIGGAIGGWVGLGFAAFWLVPDVYALFHLTTFQFGGLGIVGGYLPGIGVCFTSLGRLSREDARLAGFVAAALSAAFFSGFLAVFFACSAQC